MRPEWPTGGGGSFVDVRLKVVIKGAKGTMTGFLPDEIHGTSRLCGVHKRGMTLAFSAGLAAAYKKAQQETGVIAGSGAGQGDPDAFWIVLNLGYSVQHFCRKENSGIEKIYSNGLFMLCNMFLFQQTLQQVSLLGFLILDWVRLPTPMGLWTEHVYILISRNQKMSWIVGWGLAGWYAYILYSLLQTMVPICSTAMTAGSGRTFMAAWVAVYSGQMQ